MRLANKIAVITGAASGMGLAFATRFAAEGASVVVGDINAERLNAAVEGIRANGGKIIGLHGNIADRKDAEALVDAAVSEFGSLDVLVNNAGVMDHMHGVADLEDDMWRRIIAINLDGPMYTSRRAVPILEKKGGGSIINMASSSSTGGGSSGAAYTVAKHGLLGLTKQTAWRYAKAGIRCNAIAPGAVHTNIMESMPEDRIDKVGMARAWEFNALVPAVLEGSDVASLAVFLASDESRFINGVLIPADGGWKAA
jgi:NAD(P)-dependent dehydrogenase (short-subunit alcohol dehydrogenase family)